MTETGSSVPRRQLGRYLKQAREQAGISLESAAREMEWSRSRMYRVEAGQVPVRSYEVMALCSLYDIPGDMREALVKLAKEGKAKGWWHAYGEVLPSWFELYVGLEAAASQLRHYAATLMPGLLQTAKYAEAVFRAVPDTTEETVAQRVALRMERQKLLDRRRPAPPQLEVIVEEAALRRPSPRSEAMSGQLEALLAANERSRVSVRVLPSDAWPHQASIAGEFIILDFPSMGTQPSEPTTVYCEALTGALYLDKPRETDVYEAAWQAIDGLALNVQQTNDLLSKMIKEIEDA